MTFDEFKIQLILGTISIDAKKQSAYMDDTPNGVLVILSNDNDLLVRRCVATNPNISTGILERLCKDSDGLVRELATREKFRRRLYLYDTQSI